MEINVDSPEQPKTKNRNHTTLMDKIKAALLAVWAFLKSPVFLKNLGVLIVFLIIGFFALKLALKGYTNHGESMQVDNYIGMDIEDAERKIRKMDFLIETKEIFGKPKGEVSAQYPDPLSRVKEGRTIYLSVKNGKMEEIKIPNYSDNDNFRNYSNQLTDYGFRVTSKEVFNAKLSPGTVLHIEYKNKKHDGEDLRKGITALKGDTIHCIITTRNSFTVPLPELVCNDFVGASFILESYGLQIGQVFEEDVIDRNSAYIWKQVPAFSQGKQVAKGSKIDIYLTDTLPEGCN